MLLDQDPTVLIIHEVYYALPCPDKLTTPKGFDNNDHNIDDGAGIIPHLQMVSGAF